MMPSAASASISLIFPVSTKSFIATSPVSQNGVCELSDPLNSNHESIARLEGANAGGRASGDHIAWQQRHHRRGERDDLADRKDQLPGVGRLPPVAVHPALDVERG